MASSASSPFPSRSSTPASHTTSYTRRRVSSAASSRPQHIADIKPALDDLQEAATRNSPDTVFRLGRVALLKRVLVDTPEAKDTFRALKGFDILLATLNSLASFCAANDLRGEEGRHFLELIKCLFGVISEALLHHPGNKRFFAHRIGWDNLEQGLAATGLPTEAPDQLFGALFAFGMDDGTLSAVVQSTKRLLREEEGCSEWEGVAVEANRMRYIKHRVDSSFGAKDILLNPEVMPLILGFLLAMPDKTPESKITAMVVLQALISIASASKNNLVAMHGTRVLGMILPRIWDAELSAIERKLFQELAKCLLQMGVSHLDDAKELYRKAMTDESAASFLLEGIKSSREPPHIQFDLSLNGYAAVELATIGRPFPPSSTQGYSFSAWVKIDNFDPTTHTTLFGVFDQTQRCFILAYIEQDSKKFILQTSSSPSMRASVRFKQIAFEEDRWYHIAIVHRRSRATQSAKAMLYVDGEFVEQTKASYPQPPPSASAPVQVFLGTPSDISPRIGRGVVQSRWSMASAYLIGDLLSDDLIAVHYRLGPRYYGNFQDCLGSFQTYEASAALNMRNELMHPGKEEKSDIIAAVRAKAGNILSEDKIFLNLSATQVLDDRDDNNIDETQLVKSLSTQAAKNLQQYTRAGPVAINGAVSHINEALVVPHGVAFMGGDPIVVVPQALDDAAWRIGGGAAVGLKMVEAAKTPQQVCKAVEILFEIIKGSWRNSEAMERDNGFAVLSHLIRQKDLKGVVGQELLRLVLDFVGYNLEYPEESFIINPLAYRILLVDFDMWRRADLETQKQYFNQFVVFSSGSKYHHFNSKRLLRMRIVKKLLLALKGEAFCREILPDFLVAFKALVKTNMSQDVLRSLSLFITYSLHKHNPSRSLRNKRSNLTGTVRRPPTTAVTSGYTTPKSGSLSTLGVVGELEQNSSFTRQQIGVMVLEMYHDLLCEDGNGTSNLKKFARTVTNKWLLHLLAENEPKVVVLAARILARLLVVNGGSYVSKFASKSGGFAIMKNRLKRWWNVAPLWFICIAVLFGQDVANVNVDRDLTICTLLEIVPDHTKAKVVYPEILPVITAMLKTGVATIVSDQTEELLSPINGDDQPSVFQPLTPTRRRSMSLNDQSSAQARAPTQTSEKRMVELAKMLQSVVHYFTELHSACPSFREFCSSANFLQEIFGIIFPVVCSSDHVSAETELNSRDSALTFDGGDVIIRPLSRNAVPPIVRTVVVDDMPVTSPTPSMTSQRSTERLRRGNSFILVTREPIEFTPSSARLTKGVGESLNIRQTKDTMNVTSNSLVESLMELVMAVFVDLVLDRRDFQSFTLNSKIPPGFQEHQIYFETYLLRNTVSHLKNALSFDMRKLQEPRVLTNVGRFVLHMTDAVYEGWFLSGAEVLLDFVGTVLEYLERPDVAKLKSTKLCFQTVTTLRGTVRRLVLFQLSELDDPKADPKELVAFLDKMMYWQTVILSPENTDGDFTRLICYLLYTRLIDPRDEVKGAAANMLRIVLVQKPDETEVLLNQARSVTHKQIASGFKKLLEMDNDTWLYWIDDHRKELDAFFCGALSKSWETFVAEENKKTAAIAQNRIAKRKDTLKQWIMEDMNNEDFYGRHESSSTFWMANIYASEHVKFQRAQQDQQDSVNFIVSQYAKLEEDLLRPLGFMGNGEQEFKWRLDMTEGRNRMRKRMLPDATGHLHDYQPKRRLTVSSGKEEKATSGRPHALSVDADEISIMTTRDGDSLDQHSTARNGDDEEDDDYEMVDDPREDDDGWEDKNRKVMRSLQPKDMVEYVQNVSRLIGLDAVEGLLIIGRDYLYLIDNFFQRSDGEIVSVAQAPKDERDQYLQQISGKEGAERIETSTNHETRHWAFEDLISISKRRFLFRDVGLELFFADGRSYLLTTMNQKDRDTLHSKLLPKATKAEGLVSWIGDMWGSEMRTQDAPLNFGSKLANVFGTANVNPATKKWLRGEISNFHYLMLVNTMAGRTFNDLTQYPVFPWVLADYTSDELDLTSPFTYRDLSKPMGAQTPERQRGFRDKYRSFEELGDQSHRPFHYGTHYSSSMIVCSYLIRLQPFVRTYLMLQGGNFDHADRLFYSIEKAWISASRDNNTDVRELIPEFFFLPEFLQNLNGYNFGLKQGTDEQIDHVVLPPWAKGDPKIFVAKHREALESPYVTQHLHEWIDLVFGFKQLGEAAIEATNVYHHLSYHGAIDLDTISDPVQRKATIGIIHNFGQTPHQVFTKPHHGRPKESQPSPVVATSNGSDGASAAANSNSRLDLCAENLIRLPFALLNSQEKVVSLQYHAKHEKVYCSGAFRLNIPPLYDKYMEWGFADDSVRFYNADSKKLIGLNEHLHPGQLSAACFVDNKTLVTAGTDGTVGIWTLQVGGRSGMSQVELVPKTTLFGHEKAVKTIAVSRSFKVLVTASATSSSNASSMVAVWDLNRLRYVRKLDIGENRTVTSVAVNDVTAEILVCAGRWVMVFTVNGDKVLEQDCCPDTALSPGGLSPGGVNTPVDDGVVAAAWYEGAGNEWLTRDLIFTGHRRGVVNVWEKCVRRDIKAKPSTPGLLRVDTSSSNAKRDGGFELRLVNTLQHTNQYQNEVTVGASITAILPMPGAVYTGDSSGRVYEWDCRVVSRGAQSPVSTR